MSSDLDVLTRVVYWEARGESDEGKKGVVWEVINRSKKSGKSIKDEASKKDNFVVIREKQRKLKSKNSAKRLQKMLLMVIIVILQMELHILIQIIVLQIGLKI